MKRKNNNNEVLKVEDLHTHWWFTKPGAEEQLTINYNIDEQANPTDNVSNHDDDTDLDPESNTPADRRRGIDSDEETGNDNELPPQIVDPALLQVIEPDVVQPKGRPRGSRNKKRPRTDDDEDTSARREPSGFELAMTAD